MRYQVTAPMGITLPAGAIVKFGDSVPARFVGHGTQGRGGFLTVERPFMLKIGMVVEMKDVAKALVSTGKLTPVEGDAEAQPAPVAPAQETGANAGRKRG